jgi:hypothetical protein
MDDGTAEPLTCKVCGGPLRALSKTGICVRNPECKRLCDEHRRRAQGVKPKKTHRMSCDHPDGCPRPRWRGPYCDMHALRLEKTGELGPVGPIPQRITVPAGTLYGFWTTLEDYDHASAMVLCRCKCGRERRVYARSLRRGLSMSCGCAWHESQLARMTASPYIRTGERFGLLTALEDGIASDSQPLCRCECGTEKRLLARNLRRGLSRTCGCSRYAVVMAAAAANRTHGLSKHPLYLTWYNMVYRCHGPKALEYADWGGRGIAVYEPWRSDVAAFIDWIEVNIGPRPAGRYLSGQPFYTIDRIDVDGNYVPGNLRWADKKTQAENRRRVGSVTSQRDAALAEVERLKRLLES